MHLDALLADQPLVGRSRAHAANQHLRVLTVGFPTDDRDPGRSQPTGLPIAGRRARSCSTRPTRKLLARLRRQWFAKRTEHRGDLRETVFQQERSVVDSDAANKAQDADDPCRRWVAIGWRSAM